MWSTKPGARLTARPYKVSVTNRDFLQTERGPFVSRADRQILCQGFQRKEYTLMSEDFTHVPDEVAKNFSREYSHPAHHEPGTTIMLNLVQEQSVFNRLHWCDRCGRRDTDHLTTEQMARVGCLIEDLDESKESWLSQGQKASTSSLSLAQPTESQKEPIITMLPGAKPRKIPMQDRLPRKPVPLLAKDRHLVIAPAPTGFSFNGFQRHAHSSQVAVWNPAGIKAASGLMPVGGSFTGLSNFTFESFPGIRLARAPQHTQVSLPIVPLMLPLSMDMFADGVDLQLKEHLFQKALQDHVPSKDKAPDANGDFMQGIKKGFFGTKQKRRKPQAKNSDQPSSVADMVNSPISVRENATGGNAAIPSIEEVLAKLDNEEQADSNVGFTPSLGGTSGTSAPRSEMEDMLADLESEESATENKAKKCAPPRSELEDLLSDVEKEERATTQAPQKEESDDDGMPALSATYQVPQKEESGGRFAPPTRQAASEASSTVEVSTTTQCSRKTARRGFSAMLSGKGLSTMQSWEAPKKEEVIETVLTLPDEKLEEPKNRPKTFKDIWAQ